ncbi:MAG TPA: SMR family transporter [Alphaproteobacteria bacterium]|nr:SMR family transporter [Alphaproteobacteria bacterium]
MNWVALTLVSALFSGLTNTAFKQMANTSASTFAVGGFFMLSGLTMTVYSIVTRQQELSLETWKWAAAAAVLFTVSNIFLYRGLSAGGPMNGIYGVYGAAGLAVVAALGALFLGEKMNVYGWIGMAMAIGAVTLLANGRG